MTAYINFSVMHLAVFGIFAVLMTLCAVFLLVAACMLHVGRGCVTGAVLLMSVMMFMLQGINDVSLIRNGGIAVISFFGRTIGCMPYFWVILILVLIAVSEVLLFWELMRRKNNSLTEDAIKESLDSLPDGVCFYAQDGQPLLVNKQMNIISGELFDSEILNVNKFHSRLKDVVVKSNADKIHSEPTLITETADGRVWKFSRSALTVQKSKIYELIAFDITEQYRLSAELNQRNEHLNRVNERLRRFSCEMVTFTAEKELLNAKIAVHDNIGRSLIACRTYLMQKPEERKRKDLLFLWRYVFSVMKNEALPSDEWSLLEKTADMLGVGIELNGEMPKNLKIRTAVITAIRECLTNTANHTGGDKLFVNIREDDKGIIAEFTNSGKPPEGDIHETGGLKNLRRAAEQAGGSMTIESTPRFLLRLEFRKGEQGKWLKQEYLS